MPFLLAQLSDCHLGSRSAERDPGASLAAAVATLRDLPDRPEALLVSGDLAHDGSPGSYETVRELLEPLGLNPLVIPGNHDDRAALRAAFELPGSGAEPILYSVDLGPLRLVALDTVHPGEERGELDPARLQWLDAELAAAPGRPTLLAMHHPPLHTGLPPFDEICLAAAERAQLAAVLARHPQVLRIVCGHVHRAMVGELAGRAVLTVPATHRQSRLDFAATEFGLNDDPPGFAIHALEAGVLTSHLVPVSSAV